MKPLMPKGTAVWLVENTSLTFQQIAEFCNIALIEVQAIADDEMFANIRAVNPVQNRQLTSDEIKRCEKNSKESLSFNKDIIVKKKQTSKYTPLIKRQNKPGAIAWIIKHYPDIADNKICKLLGTTKNMIDSIRDKTHWNIKNIVNVNPVDVGLCSQYEFDVVTKKDVDK